MDALYPRDVQYQVRIRPMMEIYGPPTLSSEELLLLLIIVHIYKNSHGEVGKELYETPDVQWKKITPLLF
jgi:DNA repair protein RadC